MMKLEHGRDKSNYTIDGWITSCNDAFSCDLYKIIITWRYREGKKCISMTGAFPLEETSEHTFRIPSEHYFFVTLISAYTWPPKDAPSDSLAKNVIRVEWPEQVFGKSRKDIEFEDLAHAKLVCTQFNKQLFNFTINHLEIQDSDFELLTMFQDKDFSDFVKNTLDKYKE